MVESVKTNNSFSVVWIPWNNLALVNSVFSVYCFDGKQLTKYRLCAEKIASCLNQKDLRQQNFSPFQLDNALTMVHSNCWLCLHQQQVKKPHLSTLSAQNLYKPLAPGTGNGKGPRR